MGLSNTAFPVDNGKDIVEKWHWSMKKAFARQPKTSNYWFALGTANQYFTEAFCREPVDFHVHARSENPKMNLKFFLIE